MSVCYQEVSSKYVNSVINGYIEEIKKFQANIKKYDEEKAELTKELKKYKPKIEKIENEINQIKSDNLIRQNNIDNCKNEIKRLKREFANQKKQC